MAKEKTETQAIVNPGDLRELLLDYREKMGFSLIQMADALCLSEDTITKLENEEFETLAEPPYIRGYLRNYAKMVEADPSALISRYEALRGADPSELDYHFKSSSISLGNNNKRISPVLAQLFFLALLVSVLAGITMIPAVNKWITETWNSFSDQTNSQDVFNTDNPLLTGTMPIPAPFPGDEKSSAENLDNTNTTPSPDEASNTGVPPVEAEKTTAESENKDNKTDTIAENNKPETQEPAAEVEKEEASTKTSTKTDQIKLKLVFNKDVWMRIRDKDKKTLFEATNSAGNEKTLELKKPLTFRVGNAQGLSLFVDGKAVDISSYIKGSVANFTLE